MLSDQFDRKRNTFVGCDSQNTQTVVLKVPILRKRGIVSFLTAGYRSTFLVSVYGATLPTILHSNISFFLVGKMHNITSTERDSVRIIFAVTVTLWQTVFILLDVPLILLPARPSSPSSLPPACSLRQYLDVTTSQTDRHTHTHTHLWTFAVL